MVARSGGTCRLDGVAAFLVVLQVEPVVEIGVNVLEVRVRGYTQTAIVASRRLRNIRTAGICVLPDSTGVLVDEGD